MCGKVLHDAAESDVLFGDTEAVQDAFSLCFNLAACFAVPGISIEDSSGSDSAESSSVNRLSLTKTA